MDFHLPSLKEASNVFQLQCINLNGGLADPDARFEFNDSMGVFIRNTSTDVNEDYFIYDKILRPVFTVLLEKITLRLSCFMV